MEEHVERLVDVNERLRKNLNMQQTRVNSLAKEKATLQAEVHTLKQELNWIKTGEEPAPEQNGEEQGHREMLEPGLENSEELSSHGSDGEVNGKDWEQVQDEEQKNTLNMEPSGGTQAPEGNLDPNRPRYTRKELEEVLFERNKLKEEVFTLREELALYKPE